MHEADLNDLDRGLISGDAVGVWAQNVLSGYLDEIYILLGVP